jgi:putative transposase
MPRPRRSDLAGFPLHIVQRGNNRAPCFFTDADRAAYLHWLGIYARRLSVAIHAWVLMGNHVHLLVTPASPAHASKLMQSLGRRYVPHFNQLYERTGTLWEGRFRACAVDAEAYLLACMRYIESNPVRASLCLSPGDYRWSSFGTNALGLADALVTEHSVYESLGSSPSIRQSAYRGLFKAQLDEATLVQIRSATTSAGLLAGHDAMADPMDLPKAVAI